MICAFKNSKTNETRYVEIKYILNHVPDEKAIEDAIVSYCDTYGDDETFDFDMCIKDVLDSFRLYWSFIRVFEYNI